MASMVRCLDHDILAKWSKAVDSIPVIFGCGGSNPAAVNFVSLGHPKKEGKNAFARGEVRNDIDLLSYSAVFLLGARCSSPLCKLDPENKFVHSTPSRRSNTTRQT